MQHAASHSITSCMLKIDVFFFHIDMSERVLFKFGISLLFHQGLINILNAYPAIYFFETFIALLTSWKTGCQIKKAFRTFGLIKREHPLQSELADSCIKGMKILFLCNHWL